MKAVFLLLFLTVFVLLPEDASGSWFRRKLDQAKAWLKDKWDKLKQKLISKLSSRPKREGEVTDDDLLEVFATRDVHAMFEPEELDDSEREMLTEMQRLAREVMAEGEDGS